VCFALNIGDLCIGEEANISGNAVACRIGQYSCVLTHLITLMLEAGRKFSFEINKHENPELSAFSVEWQYGGSTAAIF